MKFTVQPMNRDEALEISRWTYDVPYDFYNMDNSNEGINELLNGTYFRILDERNLIGYCCVGNSAKVPIGSQYGAVQEELEKLNKRLDSIERLLRDNTSRS